MLKTIGPLLHFRSHRINTHTTTSENVGFFGDGEILFITLELKHRI